MAPDEAPAAASSAHVGDKKKAVKKGKKLIRPRGKRGGVKNNKNKNKDKNSKDKKKASSSTSAAVTPSAGKDGSHGQPPVSGAKGAKYAQDDKSTKGAHGAEAGGHAEKIAAYHTLQKRLAQARAAAARGGQSGAGTARAALAVRQIEEEVAALDMDLAGYQAESLRGQDLHNAGQTSKWLVKAFGPAWKTYQTEQGKRRARLLDVGALTGTAYKKYGWIDATSIDLNPMGEAVSQADFFTLAPPDGSVSDPPFDVVSLSLVVNFVGDLHARGEMLLRAHKFLTERGWVFVALPLACVANSRYLDHDVFRALVDSAGYDVVAQHDSAKLTHWLLQRKGDGSAHWDGKTFKKREVRIGPSYNNFCIRLGPTSAQALGDDGAAKQTHVSKAPAQGGARERDASSDDGERDDGDEDEKEGQEDDEDMDDDLDSDDPVASD